MQFTDIGNYYESKTQRRRTQKRQQTQQESPAVADKPARRLRKVRTVYVRAVGL